MKKLITLLFLTTGMISLKAQLIVEPIIREMQIERTQVDFGDTYIETTKEDSFYVKAPSTNTSDISVQILFDEDRTLGCFDDMTDQFGYVHISNGIFNVSVNGELLYSAREWRSFPVSNDGKGNKTVVLSPGDSVLIEIKITPANHFSTEVPEGGHAMFDCQGSIDALSSLGAMSDEITIQNISDGSEAEAIALKFNGTNDMKDVDAPCAVNIPDANFKAYLVGNTAINTNGDTEIQCGEASDFTGGIYCSDLSISDLTGIEAFTALKVLSCSDNQLTSLDVSANTNLTELYCQTNQLISLDVSSNTALTQLHCSENQLTSLDVSAKTALIRLHCDDNQLTSLNVSANTALKWLNCRYNQLTSLDVSSNTALIDLECWDNLLTSLDVSSNTALIDLTCSENQLTSLDVSSNTALTYLFCSENQLTSLDVSANTSLTELYCLQNLLTSLDVSSNTALIKLGCQSNQLTSLNVANGNNTNFEFFYALNNPNLTCIEVDDTTYSTANWTNVDATAIFSTNCGDPNGIFNKENQQTLSIFPNPATSTIYVAEGEIQIFDQMGNLVITEVSKGTVNVSGLGSGIYIVAQQGKKAKLIIE